MKLVLIPIASLCLAALALEPAIARTAVVQTPVSGLLPEDPQPVPPPPNILVIVLDDIGIDKLSLYRRTQAPFLPPSSCGPFTFPGGNPFSYPPTPNLKRIAEGQVHPDHGGILFTNAYVNPLCSPTRACLMTGRYAVRTGIGVVTAKSNDSPMGQCLETPGYPPLCYVDQTTLHDAEVFLPELLKDGVPFGGPYTSGAFGKWHLTKADGDFDHAVRNGFDVFKGQIENVRNHWSYRYVDSNAVLTTVYDVNMSSTACPADFTIQFPPNYVFDETDWSASRATQDALAWINAQQDPFFAYVAYNPPHAPYQVPPQARVSPATWAALEASCLEPDQCLDPEGCVDQPGLQLGETAETEAERKLFYRAMIEAVDSEIGLLVDGIDAGKMANTMIFVIGDNGTPSNIIDQSRHNNAHGKATVYEWGTHVPLLVSGPLVPHETTRKHTCTGLVGAVDLFPTLAAISDASIAVAGPLDGVSFLPLIANPAAASNRTYAFSQIFTPPHCPEPSCPPILCGMVTCPPNLPYTPTMAGPYVPTSGTYGEPCCCTPPNPGCQMRELSSHARSVTNGSYRYVRTQLCPPNDGFPAGSPDTPPTYSEEFYCLVAAPQPPPSQPLPADPEEQSDLFPTLTPGTPEYDTMVALRQHMFGVSGL